MSAPSTVQPSVALLDQVIAQVEALPALVAQAVVAGKTKQASGAAAARVPTETKDIRWWPIIPPGHTAYTYYGVDESNPSGVLPAGSGKPTAAAAPAAASKPTAAGAAPAAAAAGGEKPAKAEKPKGEKKPAAVKAAAAPAAAAEDPNQPAYTKLDIRVGQIVSAKRHPNPEVTSLYVEMIDVGDASGPRQVLSGLVKYIPLDVFQSAKCLVVCNLKAGNLQGEMSNGMVLCASSGEGDARVVELIQPPAGSKPGDRVVPLTGEFAAFKPLDVVDAKKKNKKTGLPENAWATAAATLKTNDKKEATWDGHVLGVNGKPALAQSMANAAIA